MTNIKKLTYYTVGGVLLVLVFFAALELASRTVSAMSGRGFSLALHELDPLDEDAQAVYQWHPSTGFIMKPSSTIIGSHPNRKETSTLLIDQHGFLAKDHGLKLGKEPGEIRVATIGASTTANLGLNYDDNWPGRLGALLQRALPGQKIRIINAAVPGFDSSQNIPNLALRVMPFSPDIVIVYEAYNDLKAIHPRAPFKPDYSHIHTSPWGGNHAQPFFLIKWLNHSMFYVRTRNKYRQIKNFDLPAKPVAEEGRLASVPKEAESTFEQHIRSLIGIARAGKAKVVLSSFATLHDLDKDYGKPETRERLSKLQRSELGALLYFTPGLTLEGILQGLTRYNAVLRKVAMEEHTGWVDNARLVPHEDNYFVDRVHFSKAGAERMADNFFPVVIKQLKR